VGVAGGITFRMLLVHRGLYRPWVGGRRRAGLSLRSVVLVGDNVEADDLDTLLADHPELGFRVSARIKSSVSRDIARDVRKAVTATQATGALIAATALPHRDLNELVRTLLDAGVHVHLSTGLQGIAHQRVQPVALAHEPLMYLQPHELAPWQRAAKRVLDLAVAGAVAVFALPVFAFLAALIKFEDGGPVLFRQQRVGENGELFTVYKLRTMVVDAEAKLAALREQNQRGDGPLFKLAADPRITRIGRLLRATSLDELPQLFNVLEGTMSLVGPRPALPSEMAEFDAKLRNRVNVKPGITGLWQLEARDNPAFGPYRRLDLFYVENWSVGLDFHILLGTFFAVVQRAVHAVLPARAAAVASVLE